MHKPWSDSESQTALSSEGNAFELILGYSLGGKDEVTEELLPSLQQFLTVF
jgi:hypothetical protein